MSIESALYDRLTNDSGVSAEVDDRIYPTDLPQDPTMPALVYQIISHVPVHSLDTGPANARTIRIQVTAYADTRRKLTDVREAVVAALDGWRDQNQSPRIDRCQWQDGSDTRVPQTSRYRDDLDFMLHYAP